MKTFRRLCLCLCLYLCLLPLCALPSAAFAQGVSLGKGINLEIWQTWPSVGDMLADPARLAPYPEWRRSMGARELAALQGMGFDFVRIPFDPAPLLAAKGEIGADLRAGLIAQILDTAEMGLDAGLRVIVDLHTFPRPDEDWGIDTILSAPPLWQDYLDIVRNVGQAIAHLPPDRILYEPINEPTLDCDTIASGAAQRWPAMLAELHKAARAGAPNLPLVLSGACWGGAWALAALPPDHPVFADPNTLFSFHDYGPFLYSHQGASWTSGLERAISGLPYPPEKLGDAQAEALARRAAKVAAQLDPPLDAPITLQDAAAAIKDYSRNGSAQMQADITRAAAWADARAIARHRVILGETGAILAQNDTASAASRGAFLADKSRAARDAGFAVAYWNYGGSGGFGLADAQGRLPADVCASLLLSCNQTP